MRGGAWYMDLPALTYRAGDLGRYRGDTGIGFRVARTLR